MRRHLLGRAAEELEPVTMSSQSLWLANFGPRCAAWIVKKHRKNFHIQGSLDLVIKESVWERFALQGGKLYYVFLALETLQRRAGWRVVKHTQRGSLRWRITWLNRFRYSRGRPTAPMPKYSEKPRCAICKATMIEVRDEASAVVRIVLCDECKRGNP